MTIKYKSDNGYTGILYGSSFYMILDPAGVECFHTGFRTINTEAELKAQVDDWPNTSKQLQEFYKKMSKD